MIELRKTDQHDDWSRRIYRDRHGTKYVDTELNDDDPHIHTVTGGDWDEPDYPVKDYKIVEEFTNIDELDQDFIDLLKLKGYRTFGNKKLAPNPVMMIHTEAIGKGESCDQVELYKQIVAFLKKEIEKIEDE